MYSLDFVPNVQQVKEVEMAAKFLEDYIKVDDLIKKLNKFQE